MSISIFVWISSSNTLRADPALYQVLLLSYFNCLKNKRHIKKSSFHLHYESTVHQLAIDIGSRRCRPGKSSIFIVTHPKPREVIAANLRDRIVHHFVYDYMAPWWDRRFVANSYACRPGKGPLNAAADLERFIRRHQRAGGAPLWYLQLDIQNFFPSIDIEVLRGIVLRKLRHPLYRWLVEVLLDHRATEPGNFMLTSPKTHWQKLPRYKSLFATPRSKGLPIGNLPSQFFANVYMNELDQFIAHKLKGRYAYWQRYVDDVAFLHTDPEVLRQLAPVVGEFLGARLKLQLNPKKTQLQRLAHGMDHLGFVFRPAARLVRRRVASTLKGRLAALDQRQDGERPVAMPALCTQVNSYLGYCRHADSWRLRGGIGRRIAASATLSTAVQMDAQRRRIMPILDSSAAGHEQERETRLQASFKNEFIGAPERQNAYLKDWLPIGDLLNAAQIAFASPATEA